MMTMPQGRNESAEFEAGTAARLPYSAREDGAPIKIGS
jgi:hypothetical protein